MAQKQQQVRRTPPEVQAIPEAGPRKVPEPTPRSAPEPERTGAEPWLMGALVLVTIAFLVLAGWTIYQRRQVTPAERLAGTTAAAWDVATPAALAGVYAGRAVLVRSDGTRVVGRKAIVASVQALGPRFTMKQVGAVGTTPDGAFVTFPYTYAGHGSGSGVAVVKVVRGKIVRQWNYETYKVAPSAPKPAQKPKAKASTNPAGQ
jgi:hypothetical protein